VTNTVATGDTRRTLAHRSLVRSARLMGITRRPRPRLAVATARMRVERSMMAGRPPSAFRSRILCYHGVGTPEWGVNDVTPARFARHMRLAADGGYRFVPARELADGTGGSADLRLGVTFDDGLRSVADGALPVLRDMSIPSTVFVVSDWAEGLHDSRPSPFLDWTGVERLAAAGVTIASHSRNHPDFSSIDEEEMVHQLQVPRRVLVERTGIDTDEFAIPFGQSKNWPRPAQSLAEAAGYRVVYAQSERRRPPGTTPRTFVGRHDDDRIFLAALRGGFDDWEEWV